MNANKPKQQKKLKVKTRKPRVKGRRLPNNRRRKANIIRGRKIAAASARGFVKKFTMLRQNGNSVRVTGRDLIYSIPDDLTSPIQNTNVISVIPANPAYWKGTRIAALASGYQNYRPIMFKITYIPMCAVTQQGNVIGGTIWDDGIDNNNLQQSLRTSNGGFMTQCYVPHTTRIRPKSNLQFNLYRMGGEFSTTSNPFLFIALAIGCKNSNDQRITPGYFYVTWSFELKNPIGSINSYNNSGLIQYSALNHELNTTIINIDPNSEIPFGAYVNIEEEDGVLKPYYNDTPIEVNTNTPTWAFSSVAKTTTTRSINKIPIIYDGITTSTIRLGYEGNKAFMKSFNTYYEVYIPTGLTGNQNVRIEQDDVVFLIDDLNQNFGTYIGTQLINSKLYNGEEYSSQFLGDFRLYKADKSFYVAELPNNNNIKKNIENLSVRFVKSLSITPNNINNDAKENQIDINDSISTK